MYFNNLSWLFERLYPDLIWRQTKTEKPSIALTFDDGPIPKVTPFVLETLEKHNVKATFFMVGDNATRNPSLVQEIHAAGHAIGNHTQNHLNGWKTPDKAYLENIYKAEESILNALAGKSLSLSKQGKKLFRPPYGLLKRALIPQLTPDFDIIMWDVLPGDFNPLLPPKICLKKAVKFSQDRSVLIFHDSVKAFPALESVLPEYLIRMKEKGFTFSQL
jgi:peptidoglycan/xylan/chitin deacetylase (PgdA/CDA1 family)